MRKGGVSRRQVRSESRRAVGLWTVGGRAVGAVHAIGVVDGGLEEVLQAIAGCWRVGGRGGAVGSCVDVVKVCAEKRTRHWALREAANVMRHQARSGGPDVVGKVSEFYQIAAATNPTITTSWARWP